MKNSSNINGWQAGGELPKETRVAVLFWRFGPYHHLRLNAAGQLMSISGVEACATENIYAWDRVDGAEAFTRITLTERDSGGRAWRQELQQKMHRALNDIKPQVVVIPGWVLADALSALQWCAETNTPTVIMSESTAWDEPRVAWKEWIKGRLVRMCAAGLAGGTPHADYLAQLGLPADKIFVGYDAVDNDYFAAKTADIRNNRLDIKKQLGLPEKYFLASARFIGKKNLTRVLEAYAHYRSTFKSGTGDQQSSMSTPWSFVLLGDGPMREELISQISALNLGDHVLMPGFKQYNELPAYYGLASAFIHASTTEQWGLVVNEAMASGLPVLVSNRCGCARDLVQEGINGFTFDPTNVKEMTGRMRQLSNLDPERLSEMGTTSQKIIANWGPQQFAQGLKAAVVAAIKRGPQPARMGNRIILDALLKYKT